LTPENISALTFYFSSVYSIICIMTFEHDLIDCLEVVTAAVPVVIYMWRLSGYSNMHLSI